jgi:epoxyqueuosine reductase
VDAGVLDSTRCLSYLTIELRGAIPLAQRREIGAYVYGCDICQEVCPYNQAPVLSADAAWRPRKGLDQPALADLWSTSDIDLVALVKGSAMTRAKLTGLRRNLAVAIGNSGDEDALRRLAETRDREPSMREPMVRAHVEWALEARAASKPG